jgi:molybdopterin converting factor small subunit
MGTEVMVLFFGKAEVAAGRREETFTAEDTAALRRQLLDKYPAMAGIPFRMALNKTILKEESALNKNDIIAILPPFQGG